MPLYINPAEYVIELVNFDFARDREKANQQVENIHLSWTKSPNTIAIAHEIDGQMTEEDSTATVVAEESGSANRFLLPFVLIHRSFIKSYRDIVAYGIRIAMYMGLAIMMGTVWLRLATKEENIQSFINAIVGQLTPMCHGNS